MVALVSADGQFYTPSPFGTTVDESGKVYVADANNNCIQEFTPTT